MGTDVARDQTRDPFLPRPLRGFTAARRRSPGGTLARMPAQRAAGA
jgi:hypothetical protein